MIEFFTAWWSYGFMRNAFIAILIITPLFGILGTMIVNNKMAFFSDALGHSALTGIALGVVMGVADTTLSMILFAVIFALLLNYISSKAFMDEVERILLETDYEKKEKRKTELIAEGISYIEKYDMIAQEQAKELILIGIEAVREYKSKQMEPSKRMVIINQAGDIIRQVKKALKKELNEAIQKLIQELKPKKRKVKPCPVQPQNISNELIPPIEYVGSEKVPENERYDYGKDDEKDSMYPMLRILKEHQECRFFQLEGIGAQTCGGVGKTYTLYGVMNQVNNAGKNILLWLQRNGFAPYVGMFMRARILPPSVHSVTFPVPSSS